MTVITDSVQTGRFYNQAGTREFAQCTAWVNFDGAAASIAIRDSLNVSSITDNGVGDYTVNFATAMDSLTYSSLATNGWIDNSGTLRSQPTIRQVALPSLRYLSFDSVNSVLFDADFMSVAIFGGITL